MARIIKREEIGMDVVSGGELYTALQVGFPMENIIFHGNNKTVDELELAIKNDVGRIVVDNFIHTRAIRSDKGAFIFFVSSNAFFESVVSSSIRFPSAS